MRLAPVFRRQLNNARETAAETKNSSAQFLERRAFRASRHGIDFR